MQDFQEAMVKSLVAVAWADGRVDAEEAEVIEALLAAFEISGEDADGLREYAKSPRTLEDIDLTELSAGDRRMLLQHAVILSFVDGEQSEKELAILDELAAKLKIPAEEAKGLLTESAERAKRLMEVA